MTPDARKPLSVLRSEWADCTRCSLSERRIAQGHSIIMGEGSVGSDHRRTILFVGGGPGEEEEAYARPFMGAGGKFLRNAIRLLGLTDVHYTNAVACRSYELRYNSEGQPITRKDRSTGEAYHVIRDAQPNPIQIRACRNRLFEQIYLIDPVFIVTLGDEALQAVTNKPWKAAAHHGGLQPVELPGAWYVPKLTDKKQAWARKVGSSVVRPVGQTVVRYSIFPTYHPSVVLSGGNVEDRRKGMILEQFAEDLRAIGAIYDRYMWETYNLNPIERSLTDQHLRELAQ